MRFGLLYLLAGIVVVACTKQKDTASETFDPEKQKEIVSFSNRLFSKERINSKEVLDSLKLLSDKVMKDTAEYSRTPKAELYINESAKTIFQVFENPKGTITALGFYKAGNEMNAAEYFDNGQVKCKFTTDTNRIRNGLYFCYHEDGNYRITGYYKDGAEIYDSMRIYPEIPVSAAMLSVGDTFNIFKDYNINDTNWTIHFIALFEDEGLDSKTFQLLQNNKIEDIDLIKDFVANSNVTYMKRDMATPYEFLFLIHNEDTIFFSGLLIRNAHIIGFQNSTYGFSPVVKKINLNNYLK